MKSFKKGLELINLALILRLVRSNQASLLKQFQGVHNMAKSMTALEVRDARRASAADRVERTEERTVLAVNGEYIPVNNSRLEEFTEILDQSGVHYSSVNKALWDACLGYNYGKIESAIRKHELDENIEMHYEFCDNYRYALAENTDSVELYEKIKMHGCCGVYDTVITVEVDTGTVEVMYGFNHGH